MDSWLKKTSESILANTEFNISDVQEMKFIKTFGFYHENESLLSQILQEGKYQQMENLDNRTKEFDEITVISFKNQERKLFYGLVYDSDELWQDPIVTRIFPYVENH